MICARTIPEIYIIGERKMISSTAAGAEEVVEWRLNMRVRRWVWARDDDEVRERRKEWWKGEELLSFSSSLNTQTLLEPWQFLETPRLPLLHHAHATNVRVVADRGAGDDISTYLTPSWRARNDIVRCCSSVCCCVCGHINIETGRGKIFRKFVLYFTPFSRGTISPRHYAGWVYVRLIYVRG